MAHTILSETTEDPIIVEYFKAISDNAGDATLYLC